MTSHIGGSNCGASNWEINNTYSAGKDATESTNSCKTQQENMALPEYEVHAINLHGQISRLALHKFATYLTNTLF